MPELPEVEVTRQGIEPHLLQQSATKLTVNNANLRWPVPDSAKQIVGQKITAIRRRGKYLLLDTIAGTTMIHLGMSGSLKIMPVAAAQEKHDHVCLTINDKYELRLNDPRRFGAWLWSELPDDAHPLLSKLGPEPLTSDFNASYLKGALSHRKKAIKQCLMDNHIVVGVGNIYANEALFSAKINPKMPAKLVEEEQLVLLVSDIKAVLLSAIKQGGTTLKDFSNAEGKPGYFAQNLAVYGRGGQACHVCGHLLSETRLGQRTTVFCEICQPLPDDE